ncbi:MAG: type II CAAX prenyl endopeptidase Rce1 family protein, partial [Rudaea sp.]
MSQESIRYARPLVRDDLKARLFAIAETLLVFAVIVALIMALRSTDWVQWEFRTLGWSYTAALVFIVVPALVLLATRRRWSDYGVSVADWPTDLGIALKAFLVALIPFFIGFGGLALLNTGYRTIQGGLFMSIIEIVAIVIMLWMMRRQRPGGSGRSQLVAVGLLLMLPIVLALLMGKLSPIIISTVIWQFALSGFGEEFAFRGYVQSRLNAAFGRPYRILGVPFGLGLIIASVLFGL